MKRQIIALVLVLALGGLNFAQEKSTVSPRCAPVGCDILITITNDTNNTTGTGNCFWTVTDDNTGLPVYNPPFCNLGWNPLGPCTSFTKAWPQVDNSFSQLPPGNYTVNVRLPNFNTESHPITIGGNAGIGQLGVQRPGKTRNFHLCAPGSAGHNYVVIASAGTGSIVIPGCGGLTFPLAVDFLWVESTNPNSQFFSAMSGTLDSNGVTTSPSLTLPSNPAISGANFYVAGLAWSITGGCIVGAVTKAEQVTIE